MNTASLTATNPLRIKKWHGSASAGEVRLMKTHDAQNSGMVKEARFMICELVRTTRPKIHKA